jgi:hypothetical protein
MTVKINADTSDGLKFVSDTSGVIDLQSNGVTKVSFDTSGNMTTSGTIPSSALTGNLPALNGSALTSLSAPNLTGALPAIDGSALTGISVSDVAVASSLPTSSLGTNGYIKFAGGYTMQWGRVTGTGTATITVSFPVTFTYIYSVVITAADYGTGAQGTTGNLVSASTTLTTSQFQFKTGGNIENQYWIATGFIS